MVAIRERRSLNQDYSSDCIRDIDMSVELCGIHMDNPVMAASGTFGYGKEFAELYDINMLGAFSFKGTTWEQRFGNPLPRIAECEGGLINSIGLQNPGVDAVISKELPRLENSFYKPIMANIGGSTVVDYVNTCEKIDGCDCVGWIELNVSCPNVHNGGMAFGTDPIAVKEITEAVKMKTTKPIIVKLSPNVTDITSIAKAAEAGGADGLSLINTMLGMRIDIKTGRPVIANKMGGFSGPAIFPVAVRMVYQVYESTGLPIVGVGGISTPEQVIEMMMAGATAVQIGSANLVDPFVCKRIIEGLPKLMDVLGIEKLSSIIGGAH